MNKASKNEAQAKSMRSYLLSDKRGLVPNAQRNREVKRAITRLLRRTNKAIINSEVE
jgi:hypothetical protein